MAIGRSVRDQAIACPGPRNQARRILPNVWHGVSHGGTEVISSPCLGAAVIVFVAKPQR